MNERDLNKATNAIDDLSSILRIPPRELILILREGMEALSPIANQLSRSDSEFISDMEYYYMMDSDDM